MAGKTILIIDDDRDLVQGLRLVLEGKGYRIVTAFDGVAGLNAAERELPDLVLVDMMMPKKSGFLVLEAIKKEGGPRVIMMTANESTRHREYAEKLGVDDYFIKPIEMDPLLASVRSLLN